MNVVVVGNFDVYSGNVVPGFSQTGSWYDFFGGDTLNVTSLTNPITLQPGEYHLYTTVKLPKPAFTGLDEHGVIQQNGNYSIVYPNPSSGDFTIQFKLNNPLHVRITVSDLFGRPIIALLNGNLSEGTHYITWNGSNQKGQRVQPGMYLYKFEAGDSTETGKLIVQ
jgi:hypothetical protein